MWFSAPVFQSIISFHSFACSLAHSFIRLLHWMHITSMGATFSTLNAKSNLNEINGDFHGIRFYLPGVQINDYITVGFGWKNWKMSPLKCEEMNVFLHGFHINWNVFEYRWETSASFVLCDKKRIMCLNSFENSSMSMTILPLLPMCLRCCCCCCYI